MTCENCGAPMRLSRDRGLMLCDYCGGQSSPPADEEGVVVLEPVPHHCPICQTALAQASLESHAMLYCAGCRGMLLDMEKFLPLLNVLREYRYWSRSSQARRDTADKVLNCPLCKREMDKHIYGGGGNVNVDSCESCNVLWLDRGELSRIVAAPDRDPQTLYLSYNYAGKSQAPASAKTYAPLQPRSGVSTFPSRSSSVVVPHNRSSELHCSPKALLRPRLSFPSFLAVRGTRIFEKRTVREARWVKKTIAARCVVRDV